MGMTGSGKSSFINHLVDREVPVGHDLRSCTQDVALYSTTLPSGQRLLLVDTPGFDDTMRQDTDVLHSIAAWLTASYSDRFYLSGIVYLHRIIDTRMTGAAMSNLRMFKKLCGQSALGNVLLATTFWGQVSAADGDRREQELQNNPDFWKNVIDHGSQVFRHDAESTSALRIVQRLVDRGQPVRLRIQREIVDRGMTLGETAAGREAEAQIAEMRAQYDRRLARLQQEWQDAIRDKDQEWQREISQQRSQLESQIQQSATSLQRLQADRDQLQSQMYSYMLKSQAAESRTNDLAREVERLKLTQNSWTPRDSVGWPSFTDRSFSTAYNRDWASGAAASPSWASRTGHSAFPPPTSSNQVDLGTALQNIVLACQPAQTSQQSTADSNRCGHGYHLGTCPYNNGCAYQSPWSIGRCSHSYFQGTCPYGC